MFKRTSHSILLGRLSESRRFIQVLSGPRQTGKTTLAHQVMADSQLPSHYASADEPTLKDRIWMEQQWEAARAQLKSGQYARKAVLVLDEVQKITGWSNQVLVQL